MGEKNEITHEFYDFIEGAGSKKSIDLKLIGESTTGTTNYILAMIKKSLTSGY